MLHTSSCRCGLTQAGYSPDRPCLTEKVMGVSPQPQGPVSFETPEKCCSGNSTRAKQLGSEGMWLPLLAAAVLHQLNCNIKCKRVLNVGCFRARPAWVTQLHAYSTSALGRVIWRQPNTSLESHSPVWLSFLADSSTPGAELCSTSEDKKPWLDLITFGPGGEEAKEKGSDSVNLKHHCFPQLGHSKHCCRAHSS